MNITKLAIPAFVIVCVSASVLAYPSSKPEVNNSQATSQEETKTETITAQESQPVLKDDSTSLAVVARVVPAASAEPEPSICGDIGIELATGICQLNMDTFNSYAYPDSKMYKVLLNANNRIYKSNEVRLYVPLCRLPVDLKGANGNLNGDIDEQFRICTAMISRALVSNNTLYATEWGTAMRSLYNAN